MIFYESVEAFKDLYAEETITIINNYYYHFCLLCDFKEKSWKYNFIDLLSIILWLVT